MEIVPAFWAGAVEHSGDTDLVGLAAKAGGWSALEAEPLRWLAEAGVPGPHREAWCAARSMETFGAALTLADPRYPPALKRLRRPPPVLFVDGDPVALHRPAVAVVGTRTCSAYGRAVAHHLGLAFARRGLVVVSGLARGVDAAAHEGALCAGLTVAVLGHGLDHTAPSSNRALRQRMLERGGAVVSSFPDPLSPRPFTFPVRNRWIVGLASAVVVVEAGLQSGAMITARLALEEGRDVYAVPANLGVPSSAGCLRLIRDGAGVVDDVEGLAALLSGQPGLGSEQWLLPLFAGATVDELARRTRRSAAELMAELGRLEVAGVVVRRPGQRYAPGAEWR